MSISTQPIVSKEYAANYPFVSVITPTYNRRKFIPQLIQCYKAQGYPKARMEWIILDDGSDPVGDLFKGLDFPNVHYVYMSEKLTIGAKRNLLNKKSCGDIIVAMDDDDYYPPQRVSAVVNAFKQKPGYELAGASEIYMYYSDIKVIYKLGPYHANHATNGTMAWKRRYADTHLYDETVTHAEEKSFLDGYQHPMIQLDPYKVMLVMSHSDNTFDKKRLRESENHLVKKTALKLRAFIDDSAAREFFASA
jgi:glycosyltransferase involved in cell wall biosynthesis